MEQCEEDQDQEVVGKKQENISERTMNMKKKSKRTLALFFTGVLLAGILPLSGSAPVQAAGYGLNNPTTDANGVTIWDCIWFGNYWQEDTNGDGIANKNDRKQPIKWRVLSVEGDDAFLLADKCLDRQEYNEAGTSATWNTCTMRSWLNGYGAEANKDGKDYSDDNFLNHAFSADEQSAIKTENVVNNDNLVHGTEGGNDTIDKVYLLSIDEATNVEYGFVSSRSDNAESRRAKNTAFTKGKGAWTSEYRENVGEDAGNGCWWLRSPGEFSYHASSVSFGGIVFTNGVHVTCYDYAVRPAMHLNLSSLSSWSYAGTVTSAVSVKATAGKVSSLKLKKKKGTVTASWKKTAGVKGYQICYSTSKKWKGKKQKLVSKNKAVIKNLKKKKTYYFRVRAYRLEGKKKVYGVWSSVKKIKIRK